MITSRSLYLGSPETIWHELAPLAAQFNTILVVGHNPGISMLAHRLGGSPCERDMKTCELVVLQASLSGDDRLAPGQLTFTERISKPKKK